MTVFRRLFGTMLITNYAIFFEKTGFSLTSTVNLKHCESMTTTTTTPLFALYIQSYRIIINEKKNMTSVPFPFFAVLSW